MGGKAKGKHEKRPSSPCLPALFPQLDTMLGSLRRLAQQAVPPASRLQELVKLRSEIFGTTFNPDSLRTGSKILKARLRGPAMLAYYGQRFSGWKGLNAAIPGLELRDVVEEQRCVLPSSFGRSRVVETSH
jgi:small subunit ribosomal protein S33